MNEKFLKLSSLFREKKYDEVIFLIQSSTVTRAINKLLFVDVVLKN